MPSHLLAGAANSAEWIVLVVGIAFGSRAIASIVRTLIEQTSCTRRLFKALDGSKPNQRPEIISAMSELEERVAAEQDKEATEETPHGKRGRKRRQD